MFDIGFWELVLLSIVALLIVGPERLPGLVRTAGFWMGKARRIVADVRDEVEREIRLEEVKRSLRQQSGADEIKKLADRVKSINAEVQQAVSDKDPAKKNPALDNDPLKDKPILEKGSSKNSPALAKDVGQDSSPSQAKSETIFEEASASNPSLPSAQADAPSQPPVKQ